MASIFDLQDAFDPSSEAGSGYNLYQKLLQQRAQIEQQRPDVAAQLPSIAGATPGERMFQSAQQQPAQDLANTVQQVTGPVTQALAGGPQSKPKDQQAAQEGVSEILSPLNPLIPKKTYGPDIGASLGMPANSGGILGLGIQPIDVLSFAIFAGLTSRMPQEQALKTTMWGASLPRQFRDNQEKQALEFVKAKQAEFNSQIAGENLLQRQQENAAKAAERQRRDAVLGVVTKRLASGEPLTRPEQQLVGVLGHGIIDTGVLKELMTPSIETQYNALKTLQAQAQADNLGNVSSTFDLPGGQKITIGEQRRGPQDVSQRTREIIAAAKESGQPITIADAHKIALEEEVKLAGNKAAATTENKPLPTATQEFLTSADTLRQTVASLRANYKADFLGPVQGTDTAFAIRRQVGSYIGSPLSKQETTFRQALDDMKNQLIYLKSGKQINEQEYERLNRTLPKATDEEKNFNAGLTRFETQLDQMVKTRTGLATTKQKDIGASSAPSAPPVLPKGVTVRRLD